MAILNLCADLGGNYITIGDKSSGLSITEISVVAVDNADKRRIVAVGANAVKYKQQNGGGVNLLYPFREGSIVDFPAAVAVVAYVFERLLPSGIFRPNIHICCSLISGLSSEDKKIYESLFVELQVKKVTFVEAPVAVYQLIRRNHSVKSCIVAVIGATVTDVAIFDKEELLSACSLFWAGEALSAAIADYVYNAYSLIIDADTVEKIKRSCVSMYGNDLSSLQFKGTHSILEVMQSCTVTAKELYSVCDSVLGKIHMTIKSMVHSLDASDVLDVVDGGLFVAGGVASLPGLDKYFADKLKINTTILQESETACYSGLQLL